MIVSIAQTSVIFEYALKRNIVYLIITKNNKFY